MRLKVWLRYIRIIKCRISRFLTHDVFEMELDNLSKWKKWLVNAYTFIKASLDDFGLKKIGIMSASLSYFCTMAVVPFLAVTFFLTGGLGLDSMLDRVLMEKITDPTILNYVGSASEKIVESARKGGFGLISALIFVWSIIWMMNRVEKVFNDVWHVRVTMADKKTEYKRNFFKGLSVDLSILFFAPFVVLFFFYGSIGYSRLFDNVMPNYAGVLHYVKSFLGWIVFAAIVILIFSAMFKYIPTAKVKYKFAFQAALISGIAFTILQYLYLETQVLVTRVNTVYGTIAAIPLFLVWLRYGWLIIMLGAQFSYSFQNPDIIKAKSQQ